MSIEIRILQYEDASILNHVASDVFDDPIVPRAVEEFLGSPHHHLAVAIEEGMVVGFASLSSTFIRINRSRNYG